MTNQTCPEQTDSRIEVVSYIVRPSGYDDLVHSDKDSWCLRVVNGQAWGWVIRRGWGDTFALNRKGEWIAEDRGSGRNKPRRYPLDEALRLALAHVDTLKLNGCTAAEASTSVAARLGAVS